MDKGRGYESGKYVRFPGLGPGRVEASVCIIPVVNSLMIMETRVLHLAFILFSARAIKDCNGF